MVRAILNVARIARTGIQPLGTIYSRLGLSQDATDKAVIKTTSSSKKPAFLLDSLVAALTVIPSIIHPSAYRHIAAMQLQRENLH
jgi:hypothetical protein